MNASTAKRKKAERRKSVENGKRKAKKRFIQTGVHTGKSAAEHKEQVDPVGTTLSLMCMSRTMGSVPVGQVDTDKKAKCVGETNKQMNTCMHVLLHVLMPMNHQCPGSSVLRASACR